MVRKLPVSIRARVQQQTARGRGLSQSVSSGFVRRDRTGQSIVLADRFEKQKQAALDNTISKISKLTNLNDINSVLNSAPSIIKPQLDQLRKDITTKQNNTITQLQERLTSKQRSARKHKQRRKDAETQSREDRARIREEEYEAEASELEKLIRQMQNGNLYDFNSVMSRVNDVGRFERESEERRIDRRNAKSAAEKQTIKEIQKLGFTPVVNADTGKLLGYQGGKESGFTEYRFDPKGNPVFLKSNRFSPVRSGGVITGYIDKVAKMSIPAPLLQRHIANVNAAAAQQTAKFKEFQGALNKIKLPKGFAFERDKLGTIVSIDDKAKGVNLDLGQLPQVTSAYLFNPVLKRIFQQKPGELFKGIKGDKNFVKDLKWYEKFSPKRVTDFTYKRRYNFYKNDFGGKLSFDQFVKQQWRAPNKNFQKTTEGQKIVKALNKSLTDQIKNPERYGTTTRVTGLLTAGSAAGLPTAGLIMFGSTYFGTLGFAKDVSRNPLPKNFKGIAKVVAKNFGMGAVQGLLYGLAFKGGGAVLNKLGKPLLKVTFGAKAAVITKGTQLAIQRGLSILGVNYVSRLSGRAAFNLKNIAIGDKEFGAAGLSKDVGILVGFSIPTIASRIIGNKKIKIQKKIEHIEKLRKGSLNAAFLKAKNAQLTDPSRGQFSSSGIVKKLNHNQIKILTSAGRSKGLTQAQLRDGSFYVQNFKVRSDVPKYEALLKVLKASAKGKTIKVKSVPKFYTFKRYGVVVAKQNSRGAVEAFAIEFNFANGKVSNVGFKTAVGKNKITAIKIYKKARAVKGKPLRVKFQDIFLVKNKIQTKIKGQEGMVKIFNRLETKKVFLNKKQLSRTQLLNFKSAVKKDLAAAKSKNLETFLKTLYKNKGVSSKSGVTNVIRIQRTKNAIRLIPSTKKSPVGFKVFPKGQYIEVGYTKFRIPSIKKIRITKPSPKIKPKRIKVKRRDGKIVKLKRAPPKQIKIEPIRIERIKNPGSSLKLEMKRGISKTKITQVKTAVKSIQTITRPRVRAGKVSKVLPVSVTRSLIRQSSILLPLVATKNAQAIRTIQRNLSKSINIQAGKQINQLKALQINQMKSLQSTALRAIQNITLAKPITPITPTITRPRRTRRPTKKSPGAIPIPSSKKGKKAIKAAKDLGYVSGLKSKPIGRVTKTLVSLPIAKERAFDILAYAMLKSKKPAGIVKRSSKREPLSIIRRKLISIPRGYFRKHRSKFLVRRVKGRVEVFEVIRKAALTHRIKKLSGKRKSAKKKVARRKPAKKKQVRRKSAKKKVARRKPAKKKPAKRKQKTKRRVKKR